MRKYWFLLIVLIVSNLISLGVGWQIASRLDLVSPLGNLIGNKKLPLLEYSIKNLSQREFKTSQIKIIKTISEEPDFTVYLFSYQTLGKTMSGQINIPKQTNNQVVLMLRGYIPPENYRSGDGTRSAAAYFAKQGFITIAPDFFGFGQSDSEPDDPWQARLEKPICVIELIKTLRAQPINFPDTNSTLNTQNLKLNLWGHSNGGQIALSVLEILNEPIPTTLWAPMVAPFPYSVLFFSNEDEDEGKAGRKYVSLLEKDYDVFEFSLTQHLDRLKGPIQLHQGTADTSVLVTWTDQLINKLKMQNEKRKDDGLTPVDYQYFVYPGADHNLKPDWDTVVVRDVKFFNQF